VKLLNYWFVSQRFEAEARPNKESSSYLKENTTLQPNKDELFNAV
jgi:hypothetical protein